MGLVGFAEAVQSDRLHSAADPEVAAEEASVQEAAVEQGLAALAAVGLLAVA